MEARRRNHGNPQHQEFPRSALSEAPGAGPAGAPLVGSGGHPPPPSDCGAGGAALYHGIRGSGQGALGRDRCGRVHPAGERLLGLLTAIGEGPIGLDSAIFIYFIERNPRYLSVVRPLFQAIANGSLSGVTSGLTLMETLVVPLRAGNAIVAHQYERFLRRRGNLRLIPLDFGLLRAAAHGRATTRLKTPDASQVASAL